MTATIRCIIVDDESAVHNVLKNLLGRHCPGVLVCGSAFSAEEGAALIQRELPDLVFLDIKMPGLSGFEMLQLIGQLNFDVIFISGFSEYAIQAFEFNAVDYVLKPIDYTRLITAVDRAAERIQYRKGAANSRIIHFIRSLEEQAPVIRKLTLHHQEKVHLVDLAEVACIRSAGSYSEITTAAGKRFVSAKTLGEYEAMLGPLEHFFRISRHMLINADHISHYTKGSNCFISLRGTDEEIEVSRRRKTAILAALHNLRK